jgi:triacylglycerol esterase/lipase EstA (alpha/beta hydrolase family)
MQLAKKIDQSRELTRVAAREIGAHLLALNLYPLGLVEEFRRKDQPHPKFATNQRPLLLVHGVIHNHSAFIHMKRGLQTAGFKNVFTVNYTTRHGYFPKMVHQLSQRVNEVMEITRSDRIDIVAHSLGGLVARSYMVNGEGRGKIASLVTLGTPHRGTKLSPLLKTFLGGPLFRDLRVGSKLIEQLNSHSLPRDSKIVSIYSKNDWTIWPQTNCQVDGFPSEAFQSYEVNSVGHMGLLYSSKVLNLVVENLRNPHQLG